MSLPAGPDEKTGDNVLILTPASEKVQRVQELLKRRAGIEVHLAADVVQATEAVAKLLPCLVILSANSKEQILQANNFLKANRESLLKKTLKTMVLSNYGDRRMVEAFQKQGCNEYIVDSIPENSLFFKISLQLKTLRSIKAQSEDEELEVRLKGQRADVPASVAVPEGAARPSVANAVQLAQDVWLIRGEEPKKSGRLWMMQLEGPDPMSGEWIAHGKDESGQKRWLWKSRSEDGTFPPASAAKESWVFTGSMPAYQPGTKKWKMTAEKPELSLKKGEQVLATKYAVKNDVPVLAPDTPEAEENIKKSQKAGQAAVNRQRELEASQKAKTDDASRAKKSGTAERSEKAEKGSRTENDADPAPWNEHALDRDEEATGKKKKAEAEPDGAQGPYGRKMSPVADKKAKSGERSAQAAEDEENLDRAAKDLDELFGSAGPLERKERRKKGAEKEERDRKPGSAEEKVKWGKRSSQRSGDESATESDGEEDLGGLEEASGLSEREAHAATSASRSREKEAKDRAGEEDPKKAKRRGSRSEEGSDEADEDELGAEASEKRKRKDRDSGSETEEESPWNTKSSREESRRRKERETRELEDGEKPSRLEEDLNPEEKSADGRRARGEKPAKAGRGSGGEETTDESDEAGESVSADVSSLLQKDDGESRSWRPGGGSKGKESSAGSSATGEKKSKRSARRRKRKKKASGEEKTFLEFPAGHFGDSKGVWERVENAGFCFVTPQMRVTTPERIQAMNDFWHTSVPDGEMPFFEIERGVWLFEETEAPTYQKDFLHLPAPYVDYLLNVIASTMSEKEAEDHHRKKMKEEARRARESLETAEPAADGEENEPQSLQDVLAERRAQREMKKWLAPPEAEKALTDEGAEKPASRPSSGIGFALNLANRVGRRQPLAVIYESCAQLICQSIRVDGAAFFGMVPWQARKFVVEYSSLPNYVAKQVIPASPGSVFERATVDHSVQSMNAGSKISFVKSIPLSGGISHGIAGLLVVERTKDAVPLTDAEISFLIDAASELSALLLLGAA